jgi:drug/metabolite transporter (DMT)-like permease
MPEILQTLLIGFAAASLTIWGDFLIKKASLMDGFSGWRILLFGGIVYGFSALGWFFIFRTNKFFTVGAISSFGIIILSILLSLFVFDEKINRWEVVGLVLGIISLVILIANGKS